MFLPQNIILKVRNRKYMKLGILTYHRTTNYGAIFQTYALQQFILSKNIDCEVIDYLNKTLKRRYSLNPLKKDNIKQSVKSIINIRDNIILKRKFVKFLNENISLSCNSYDEKNIALSNGVYDRFIVGSDQVWNLKLSGNDINYYLNFVENDHGKNSYAASFGINQFEKEELNEINELLRKFSNISVREKQGVDLLNKLEIENVNQNIDPVFLLDKNKWEKFTNKRIKKEKYIFVYEITYTPNLIDYAKHIAQKMNCDVVFVSGSNRKVKGFINLNKLSPVEFLTYLKYSEYVVTSSFHGTAFSIIFEKKFNYDLPKRKGNTGSRLTSLANLLNLGDREILPNFDECVVREIDYSKVKEIIKVEIEKSNNYIEKVIEKREKNGKD